MAVELVGKLRLDGAGWRDGLTKAKSDAKRFGAEVGGVVASGIKSAIGGVLGFVGATAVLASLKAAIDKAGTLRDTSTNLRTTIEEYQAFTFALLQSGAKAEDAATVLTKLALAQDEAVGGNERYVSAFQRLGVSFDNLKTGNTVELFARLADAVEKNGLNTKELSDLYEILGKGAAKVTAVLRADFRETFEQGLGVAITAEEVEKLANIGDRLTTIGFQIQKVWAKIGSPIAEQLIYLINFWGSFFKRFKEAFSNGDLISTVLSPYKRGGLFGIGGELLTGAGLDANRETDNLLKALEERAIQRKKDINQSLSERYPDIFDQTLFPLTATPRSQPQAKADAFAARGLFLDARRDKSERQTFYTKFLRVAERIEKGVENVAKVTKEGFDG